MNDITNLSDTIIAKSDQLNAVDLLSGSMVITVTSVARGNAQQPIIIGFNGDNGRPYKPSKGFRRILVGAWGEDGTKWIGRKMKVFIEPTVMWGGEKVGGIRVSELSHIDKPLSFPLVLSDKKRINYTVHPLVEELPKVLSIDQLTVICDLIFESKVPIETVLERYKVATKEQIPATAYDTLVKNLNAKIEANKQQSE